MKRPDKLDKSHIVSVLEQNKGILAKNFHIRKIGLFGSYSTDSSTEDSDIDLIYELEEGWRLGIREVYELETFLKDLFKVDELDLVNQKYVNPIVEEEINKTAVHV